MSRMKVDRQDIRDADVFQILLDNFPDIIHSVDGDGRIVFTNRKATELLGYERDELLGMRVHDIYADDILAKMEDGFSHLQDQGDTYIPESALKAKDGTRIPVEIRSFSIYDDDGTFLKTFSVLRDIRPIKELQNSLVHAGRLAAIGELASGVAHDINNPLTVVLLSNEMASRQLGQLPVPRPDAITQALRFTEDIGRAGKAIQKLVDHLRNFSRGIKEKYQEVDLWSTFNDAQFMARNRIISAGVTVTDETEPNRFFTRGSPNQLEQVFVNLIANACDAMADREQRDLFLAITPEERDNGAFWRCEVRDTGAGIPEDVRQQIFQSFFTTKEKGKGTGLGLSISRGIVRDHGGEISVTSTPGEGTAFCVCLPQHEKGTPVEPGGGEGE